MVRTTLLYRPLVRVGLPVLIAASLVLVLVTLNSLAANTIAWQETSTGLPTSNIVRDTEFADVNHDGKPDLIAVGNIGVAVYQGNGAGVWASGVLSFGLPASGSYGHVAVGDLDNDGNVDIVASAGNGVGVKGWYGDGAGNWTAIASGLPTGTSEGVALGDVNKDGRPDIIVAGGSTPVFPGVHVYLNQGSSFSETTALTTTGTFNDIAAAYVDGDGYIDVVAAADSHRPQVLARQCEQRVDLRQQRPVQHQQLARRHLWRCRSGWQTGTGGRPIEHCQPYRRRPLCVRLHRGGWHVGVGAQSTARQQQLLQIDPERSQHRWAARPGGGRRLDVPLARHLCVAGIDQRFRSDDLADDDRQLGAARRGRLRSRWPARHRRGRVQQRRRAGVALDGRA